MSSGSWRRSGENVRNVEFEMPVKVQWLCVPGSEMCTLEVMTGVTASSDTASSS